MKRTALILSFPILVPAIKHNLHTRLMTIEWLADGFRRTGTLFSIVIRQNLGNGTSYFCKLADARDDCEDGMRTVVFRFPPATRPDERASL